jgi:hypothetical protein
MQRHEIATGTQWLRRRSSSCGEHLRCRELESHGGRSPAGKRRAGTLVMIRQ